MTRILLTPLIQDAVGTSAVHARLTARPVFPFIANSDQLTFAQMLVWTFDPYSAPNIDLDPPAVGSAWTLVLVVGATTITRTVTFTGNTVAWSDLTDVDPATLSPTPDNDKLAAWIAVQQQIQADTESQLSAHVAAPSPHPAYDDMADLTLIFENVLESGLVVDDSTPVPDFNTVFNNSL